MQDGMEVTFSEVVGMEELNDGRSRKVKNCKVSTLISPLRTVMARSMP